MRAGQLQNLTRVSSLLTSSLKQEELVDSLLGCCTWSSLTIRQPCGRAGAARSPCYRPMATRTTSGQIGLTAAVEDSALFLEMIRTGEPIAIGDVRSDARFSSLVEPDNLSWLGLPLIVKGEVIGLIAMDKREPDFFNADYIQAASTFASQAAVAMENARLFEESVRRAAELDQRSQRLALLNRLSESWAHPGQQLHPAPDRASELLSAMDAVVVACVMVGPGDKFILELEVPPQLGICPMALLDVPIFERLRRVAGPFQYRAIVTRAGPGHRWCELTLAPREIAVAADRPADHRLNLARLADDAEDRQLPLLGPGDGAGPHGVQPGRHRHSERAPV